MKITLLQPIRAIREPTESLPRSEWRRLARGFAVISTLVLVVSAVLLVLSVPALAAPEEGGMRWPGARVCVDLHASDDGEYWYTSGVTKYRMDTLPTVTYRYRADCAASGYRQIIHVYEQKRLNADGTCDYSVYGSTLVYDTPDGYTYDGYISRATVNLNDCWVRKLSKDTKQKIVGHELMHAIGPGHWGVCPSLVGPSCKLSAYWPDQPDDDRVRAWYA